MGTCIFQFHFHDSSEYNDKQENQENSNNIVKINSLINSDSQIIKSKSPNNILLKNKSNIEKKLSEIGKFISVIEFENLMNKDIKELISRKKFYYKKYIKTSIVPCIKLEPFQFTDTQNIYYGAWNADAEMEGEGVFYSHNNNIFIEGFWEKGENICGRIFFKNNDIYEGAILNCMPNGEGELFESNGDRYIGNFKNGDLYGKCVIIFADNTIYQGNIENKSFNGQGKMTWNNGTEYIGNFENNTLSGNGLITMKFSLGNEKYEGNFMDNEFNGNGKYIFHNGDIYEGEYENGIKKGKGKYTKKIEDKVIIFEGNWINDLPNGNGVIKYGEDQLSGFWRNGDFINSNDEIDNNNILYDIGIDKNIKPEPINIFPSSLPHLNIANDTESNQYIPNFI